MNNLWKLESNSLQGCLWWHKSYYDIIRSPVSTEKVHFQQLKQLCCVRCYIITRFYIEFTHSCKGKRHIFEWRRTLIYCSYLIWMYVIKKNYKYTKRLSQNPASLFPSNISITDSVQLRENLCLCLPGMWTVCSVWCEKNRLCNYVISTHRVF